MAPKFAPTQPPLLTLRPWEDTFVPLAQGVRAARSLAARALGASAVTEKVFCAWAMRQGEGLWTGGDSAFGAMLFVDGSALLGESIDGSTLLTAPLVTSWRGLRGESPQAWLAGDLGGARRERLEQAAWAARDRTLWRPCAQMGERWTQIAQGRKGLAPWKACSARLDDADLDLVSDLVWALVDAGGAEQATLLGATLDNGRIQGPTLVAEGLSGLAKARIGAALAHALESHWGADWIWRLFAQHWEGRGAPILGLNPPQSAHRRLAAAQRFA